MCIRGLTAQSAAQWIYTNTSFTSEQAKAFADSLSSDQLWTLVALIEAAYEAGFDDAKATGEAA